MLSSTISAEYAPHQAQGSLYVRLGKPGAQLHVQGEHEVARFTVPADPASTVRRVLVQVDQQPHAFKFTCDPPLRPPSDPARPGPATKYDTHFTVVLVGATLEFRTVFNEPEGAYIKTIQGKQSVQLPLPPRLQDVSVAGTTLTVAAGGGEQSHAQPDVDVPITQI